MKNPQDNMRELNTLLATISTHPMCLYFKTNGNKYFVKYPDGMCLDGAQADFSNGKIIALQRLLKVMERHWLESCVH